MNAFDQYEVWFVTGAQLLYGGDAVSCLSRWYIKVRPTRPRKWKLCSRLPTTKNAVSVSSPGCTPSRPPRCGFTACSRDTMDMDFMNLNQSAHGDREFGHICTRMRIRRKVVVGYWKEEETQKKIAVWMRVCAAWADAQDMLIIRFGDQMNNVAVTDGDKVEAEQRMGYHVD